MSLLDCHEHCSALFSAPKTKSGPSTSARDVESKSSSESDLDRSLMIQKNLNAIITKVVMDLPRV